MVPVSVAIVAISALSGCGTMVGNLGGLAHHHNEIYGGVRVDGDALKEHMQDREWLAAGVALLDMPFSAVADTLTLPITVKATLAGEAGEREVVPLPASPDESNPKQSARPASESGGCR
jgi:uncharacterized protein YceK